MFFNYRFMPIIISLLILSFSFSSFAVGSCKDSFPLSETKNNFDKLFESMQERITVGWIDPKFETLELVRIEQAFQQVVQEIRQIDPNVQFRDIYTFRFSAAYRKYRESKISIIGRNVTIYKGISFEQIQNALYNVLLKSPATPRSGFENFLVDFKGEGSAKVVYVDPEFELAKYIELVNAMKTTIEEAQYLNPKVSFTTDFSIKFLTAFRKTRYPKVEFGPNGSLIIYESATVDNIRSAVHLKMLNNNIGLKAQLENYLTLVSSSGPKLNIGRIESGYDLQVFRNQTLIIYDLLREFQTIDPNFTFASNYRIDFFTEFRKTRYPKVTINKNNSITIYKSATVEDIRSAFLHHVLLSPRTPKNVLNSILAEASKERTAKVVWVDVKFDVETFEIMSQVIATTIRELQKATPQLSYVRNYNIKFSTESLKSWEPRFAIGPKGNITIYNSATDVDIRGGIIQMFGR